MLTISELKPENLSVFKRDMQEAFQLGYEDVYGPSAEKILPEKDIDASLKSSGSQAYIAVIEEKIVGGAIVVIDEKTQHNHLDLLYVKPGYQGEGIGYSLWKTIEEKYPQTCVWETHTPYFEKRNIHFYINKCGFHIVEFYTPWHKDPHMEEERVGGMDKEAGDYFFRFEKKMC